MNATDTETIPDWALGYSMTVPCLYDGCENEAEWFADQHGCTKGYICDVHRKILRADTYKKVAKFGFVICGLCYKPFVEFEDFIKLVRI